MSPTDSEGAGRANNPPGDTMSKPFALATSDPAFDPRQPVTVNGYLYVPAEVSSKTVAPNSYAIRRRRELLRNA